MVVGWMIFHKEEAYKAWNMAVRGKNMKEKVFNYLTTVPKGKVVTYGQIASYLGNRKLARVVGNILHNNPDKNIKYLTKNVVDNYVPSNYKEAVMSNESLSRNVVLLAATASELGYNNNEIKDIIKVGLSSEKPLTIPQVLKKYDPKKYKTLEKIGISDIPTLVGSALFGTPARVYDKLTGQKNDY